jgi:hypothetical protein
MQSWNAVKQRPNCILVETQDRHTHTAYGIRLTQLAIISSRRHKKATSSQARKKMTSKAADAAINY